MLRWYSAVYRSLRGRRRRGRRSTVLHRRTRVIAVGVEPSQSIMFRAEVVGWRIDGTIAILEVAFLWGQKELMEKKLYGELQQRLTVGECWHGRWLFTASCIGRRRIPRACYYISFFGRQHLCLIHTLIVGICLIPVCCCVRNKSQLISKEG